MRKRHFVLTLLTLLFYPSAAVGQQLIEVDGRQVEVLVKGEGTAIVVLEAGHGEVLAYLEIVQDKLESLEVHLGKDNPGQYRIFWPKIMLT